MMIHCVRAKSRTLMAEVHDSSLNKSRPSFEGGRGIEIELWRVWMPLNVQEFRAQRPTILYSLFPCLLSHPPLPLHTRASPWIGCCSPDGDTSSLGKIGWYKMEWHPFIDLREKLLPESRWCWGEEVEKMLWREDISELQCKEHNQTYCASGIFNALLRMHTLLKPIAIVKILLIGMSSLTTGQNILTSSSSSWALGQSKNYRLLKVFLIKHPSSWEPCVTAQ